VFILLLFEVGLETDMGKLLGSGGKVYTVAIVGFVAPLLGVFVAGLAFSCRFFLPFGMAVQNRYRL
jgi:Kef-type K+ transport system membrane component KefB